jgi:hypothetical protein
MESKMHFARFAKSAVLLLLILGFAAPVHAQNNKQIVSGDFYEDRASNTVNSSDLGLTFAQSPAGKFLNVTNVSCEIGVSSTQALAFVDLTVGTSTGAGDIGRPSSIRGNVSPETTGNGTTKFYSIVTNQIYYKMGSGKFPSISISTAYASSPFVSASCVIVGNLTDS